MIIIQSITTKAHSHDCVTADMMCRNLNVTLPITTVIINISKESNISPETWKTAKVKPFPKGSKEIKYLRPISIMPIFRTSRKKMFVANYLII